ncbi:MAG: tyrosine--tRNA ligase [Candidatus Paceibacterota bacterium]|jgi:tyrosyl-tRNA synthetase
MKIITDEKKIDEILTRGVEDIFIKEDLKQKLRSGKQLRIKLGFDPTGSKIHIGRAIILRKLRAFQELGHQIIFIVGDFTAQVGDPSDKLEKRPMLQKETIKQNLKTYKKQVGKIIDLSKAKFYYNSTWLKKLGFQEISELAESFSIQQMSARRNFKDRFEKGEEVSLREFMYPLMQGYDSVKVKADVEIGGFDQLFNLKAGRIIQKHYGLPEQNILTCQMLEGTDGRKMSTSWGNIITIVDEPNDMFGKIMSLKDELITKYFLLTTNMDIGEIEKMKNSLKNNENPMVFKKMLGKEIVTLYHGKEKAEKAQVNWENVFSKKEIPEDVLEVEKGDKFVNVFLNNKIISSKTEFRRLVDEGAITNLETEEKIKDYDSNATSGTYRIGKKRFIRIK